MRIKKFIFAILFAACVQNVNAEVSPIASNVAPTEFTSVYTPLGDFANAAAAADVYWADIATNTVAGFVIASSNTITAKSAGLFLCIANLQTDQATGKLTPGIYHNDVLVSRGAMDPVSLDDSNSIAVRIIYANTNDTFKVKANVTTAGGSIVLDGGIGGSYFQCGKL